MIEAQSAARRLAIGLKFNFSAVRPGDAIIQSNPAQAKAELAVAVILTS